MVVQAIHGLRREGGVTGIYQQYVTLFVVDNLIKPRTQVYGSAGLAGLGKSLYKVVVRLDTRRNDPAIGLQGWEIPRVGTVMRPEC